MNKTVNIAVIGTGNRGIGVIHDLLMASGRDVNISAIYEPAPENAHAALIKWNSSNVKICCNSDDAINDPDVDMVMIFTPNYLHKKYIIESMNAGKNVFAEKPLATTIADCQEICKTQRKSGKWLMTGFVLRYSPLYRKVKELLESGKFGRILNISASENRNPIGGEASMNNWRCFSEKSGPYILEKCSHGIDLLHWFAKSLPARVACFGGLDFFIPENKELWDKYGRETFSSHVPLAKRECPFTSEKDVKDNHVAIIEFKNGIKANFQFTLANAIPERRMYISCTEGTIALEFFSGELKYRTLADTYVTTWVFKEDGHDGGDIVMIQELWEMLKTNTNPQVRTSEGLECAVTCLGIDESMNSNLIVDMDPIWKSIEK